MGVDFYTLVRSATGKPLRGGWLDKRQVLAALRPMGMRRAESEAKRPVIPTEDGHPIRSKAATDSDRRRPPC